MSSKWTPPERLPSSESTLESRLAELGRLQAFESDAAAGSSRPEESARGPSDCPSLPTLIRHFEDGAPLPGPEHAEHVLSCPRCIARRRALTETTRPVAQRNRLLRRLQWLTTIAALLLLGVTISLWTPLLERGPDLSLLESESVTPGDGLPAGAELVRVAHVPSNVAAGPRVDLFALSANEPRSVVVLVRGWERGCRCVQWQTPAAHSGSHEIFRGIVQPGEDLMVELDVTDHPPIEQYLVVITARNPDLLPESIHDTEELFCCLERQTPSSDAEDVAESCLPNGVAVMTQPFTVD